MNTNPSSTTSVETTVATVQAPSVLPQWMLHFPDVGILTGTVLGAVVVFGYVLSKFKKDTTVNSVEGRLYQNLSDRIEVISKTLGKVEAERASLISRVTRDEIRISELEKHEKENAILRELLNKKDIIIDDLQKEIDGKTSEIDKLKDRVHGLEMRMAQKVMDCSVCDHKRFANDYDLTRRSGDVIPPIGDEI